MLCVPVQRLRHVDKAFALSVIFHVKAEVEVVYFDVSYSWREKSLSCGQIQ